jgi:hypothetical protein
MSDEKTIDTLIEDIGNLFHDPDHKVDPQNLELFGKNCMAALQESIEEATTARPATLRMSKVGTPDRKLWYEMNNNNTTPVAPEIDPALLTKFLYGHILEELVLFLCREAGHKVEGEQDECDIGGIKGHRDCKIDNVVVDVKSASKFAFEKFRTGKLFKDDPFGYIPQISGYVQADEEAEDYGAFLTINKESGELTLLKVEPIDMVDAEALVEHKKKVAVQDNVPVVKCYEPRPQYKDPKKDNGNKLLHWNCSYCKFKDNCWADANGGDGIRRFKYANKVEEFVEVKKVPKVEEIL